MKFNEIYFGNGLFTSQSGFQLTVSQKSATFNLILIFRCYCSVTKSYPTLLTPWTAACQVSLSFTISWNLHKFMSTESVMPSNHFILCCPFSSCPQSFPASGSFPISQLFASGSQSIGVSASTSVFPMNIQD